jgi:hypothetical protein
VIARCYQNNPGDMTRIARTSARRAAAMTSSPFQPAQLSLGPRAAALRCASLPQSLGLSSLAAGIVAMEPWSVMNYPVDKLAAFLARPDGWRAMW